jgi:hypothetical protein
MRSWFVLFRFRSRVKGLTVKRVASAVGEGLVVVSKVWAFLDARTAAPARRHGGATGRLSPHPRRPGLSGGP